MLTSFPRGLLGSILGERELVFKSLPGRPRLRHFRELKEVIKFTKGSHTSRVLPQERTAEDVGLHNSFPSEGLGAAGPFVLLEAAEHSGPTAPSGGRKGHFSEHLQPTRSERVERSGAPQAEREMDTDAGTLEWHLGEAAAQGVSCPSGSRPALHYRKQ